MIPFTLNDIANVLQAKLIGNNIVIELISTDSRSININPRCLFVALKGNRFDAHDFAYQATPCALLVNHKLPIDTPQLIVADTKLALGQLGAWVRKQVPTKIVAITGSSGKTSVKEMTAAILRQSGQVLATAGNLNNDIGVSLTLLRLTKEHNYAVVELGASHPGEIKRAAHLVCPDTALINNLSVSHLTGFGSISGIAQAKGEIFSSLSSTGIGVINDESNDWIRWSNTLKHNTVWRFALKAKNGVDFFASNIKNQHQGLSFTLNSPIGKCTVRLPLTGKHNIANAIAASALAISVGAGLPEIATGLSSVSAIPGRMFPIMLRQGQLLLDDSYNANIGSMHTAMKVLSSMPGYKVMVIGDMEELGSESARYHQQIGEAISSSGINKVLSVGKLSRLISKKSGQGEHFQSKKSLITHLINLLSKQITMTILVKGSRKSTMEQVVQALQRKAIC